MAGGIGEFIGQLFGGAAGAGDGVHARVWRELKGWVAQLGQAATAKWVPRIAAEMLCEIPVRRRGQPVGECDHFGVAPCDVCGRATCLAHGRIDATGDIICFECIQDAQQVVPPFRRDRERRQAEAEAEKPPPKRSQGERARERRSARQAPPGAGADAGSRPPPNPNQVTPQMVAEALRALGLKPGASWDDVRAAHRKISGANHPDRFANKSRREQKEAEARYIGAQKALDVLRRVMQQ